MNVEDREINGFLIDEFNQYGLEVVRHRVYALGLLNVGSPLIKRRNVLLMTGNVVLVPVIIVILVFNYIRINVKVLVKRFMLDHKLSLNLLAQKLKSGLSNAA